MWMPQGAVCQQKSQESFSRLIAAILLFPVLSGTVLSLLSPPGTAGLTVTSAHGPCGAPATRTHRQAHTPAYTPTHS